MKTLAEVLREADPLGPLNNELRVAVRERRRARPMIANGPGTAEHMPKRRAAMATIFALALGGVAAIVFNWPYPMDVVAAVRFEVHLAEENPAPGLREVAIPGTEREIYVHQEAVVVNSDIARAQVAPGQGNSNFAVDVTFTAEGAAKMRLATQNHIGRPIAILVDGNVVLAPVVRDAISTSAMITGDYSRADAERIVAGILGR
jgi:hypothetical protein